MPVIGFLNGGTQEGAHQWVAAFRKSLNDAGYFEGQNVAIEYHWAEGEYDRLPAARAKWEDAIAVSNLTHQQSSWA